MEVSKIAKELKFQMAEKAREEITISQKKKIKKMYENVSKDFMAEYEKLKGKDNISSILKRQYIEDMNKNLKSEMKKISKEVKGGIEDAILQTSEAVVKDNAKFLKGIGFEIKSAYSFVPDDVVKTITSGQLYQSDWSLAKSIWGDDKKIASEIDNVIAAGITGNKSAFDIAKDLETYVSPSAKKAWDWGRVYPGSRKQIDYNAQRLSRTMVSHAYQESLVRSTQLNPFIKGYQWVTSNSHTEACEVCRNRATQDLYGLGAGIYPKDKLPLDHPNGKCIITMAMTGTTEDMSNEIADWYNAPNGTYPKIDKFSDSLSGGKSKTKANVIKPKEVVKDIRNKPTRDNELNAIKNAKSGKNVVDGKDISSTWEANWEEYEQEIDDILTTQKFNGLPRVVNEKEFNEAVEQSNFIAQRVYNAKSKETLEAYKQSLRSGEWYVDCSTSNAAYGQGMYTTSDYAGKLTKGMAEDIEYFKNPTGVNNLLSEVETFTLDPSSRIIDYDALDKMFWADEGYQWENITSFAAAKGYDGVKVAKAGNSESFTVILNRTKLIIKE